MKQLDRAVVAIFFGRLLFRRFAFDESAQVDSLNDGNCPSFPLLECVNLYYNILGEVGNFTHTFIAIPGILSLGTMFQNHQLYYDL